MPSHFVSSDTRLTPYDRLTLELLLLPSIRDQFGKLGDQDPHLRLGQRVVLLQGGGYQVKGQQKLLTPAPVQLIV